MAPALKNKIDSARTLGFKALAAYSTAQVALKTAKATADKVCHVWRVDNDYATETYEAAMLLARKHQTNLPLARRTITIGDTYREEGTFNAIDWAWLRVPGISPAVQARCMGGGVIEFRAFRMKDINAIQERVEEMADEMFEDDTTIDLDFQPVTRTEIYSWDKDEWNYRTHRVARTFDSVVLPKATQKEIEAELHRFAESRERLTRLEMPWRRGYLLSGPPGTGKTSLSLAIAGALNFKLATLSLTDIKSDGALRKAVGNLPGRTVLVIEDIDAYSVSHERDHNTAQDGALSLSGLLNSLDGFETPDGLVTILTTNHIEKLDPALVRSGRVDRVFDLGYIEGPELERLFTWFYELEPLEPAPEATGRVNLSPAEATELFKQNLEDPVAGWIAVRDRINNASHKNLEVVA